MSVSEPDLSPYNSKIHWRQIVSFSAAFVLETFSGRRLSRLMRRQTNPQRIESLDTDNIPEEGMFTFAVNHFSAGSSIGVISALLKSANLRRPDIQDVYLMVVGQRVRADKKRNPAEKAIRWCVKQIKQRWSRSVIHIAIGNDRPTINHLRNWRRRCRQQPIIIFPEGIASLEFKTVRQGAGKWLSSFPVPTLPVGVWWHKDRWHVRFGKPIEWSSRTELRDIQLGLSIASLLPGEIASSWKEDLCRWRSAHSTMFDQVDLPEIETECDASPGQSALCNCDSAKSMNCLMEASADFDESAASSPAIA